MSIPAGKSSVLVHPGRLLRREMEARGLSATALAGALHVSPERIRGIINGKRPITYDTALRLGRYLGTGPELWAGMQRDYNLLAAQLAHGAQIEREVQPAPRDWDLLEPLAE
ncbi:plasmid maintenance system antidote protein [Rhodospirillum rubrum F11]|uniref:Plasmid maintenance system antidote protein n=1 Tax=Rhodospirillum rubrum (strain ATCC 11170 / ATH 1.1.1 / DSM 467 / LMG 4362 / NCIMB 8255 / S1) TaxID=269796 RepID=Q2RP39_RHORT|nr:HigA family addiction module antitoxin [Rhodospirillum rubrum]ABC24106.1 Plasmid maintenance system antidote protein [Rhodospirillum rubrum ATCC 11170]AEO49852.1 plasmid maintenance system antidote protein [Rhodospirillum rubrum F11]MBK5955817.1 transcriptional regulator [Rhodospirillum rubrum]QXG80047.1 HigA family addiction module antidote protein [Rhodospirillum rubrum]